jgi:hypothetical protein
MNIRTSFRRKTWTVVSCFFQHVRLSNVAKKKVKTVVRLDVHIHLGNFKYLICCEQRIMGQFMLDFRWAKKNLSGFHSGVPRFSSGNLIPTVLHIQVHLQPIIHTLKGNACVKRSIVRLILLKKRKEIRNAGPKTFLIQNWPSNCVTHFPHDTTRW